MDLKKTVELMVSEDYKERFKAEYYQGLIRFNKLKEMIDQWDSGELDFVPTCPRSIYDMQLNAMSDYISTLEVRASMENIKLEKVEN